MRFIDLFAGAGGFSEGFKRAGFEPVAFVEMDPAACFTLKTRLSYHYLKENNKLDIYTNYLKGEINREQLYSIIPSYILESVINLFIGDENNSKIFQIIEKFVGRKDIDVVIGGSPCQAYSFAGRSRDRNGMREDPRNYLYVQYEKFLKKYSPKLFIFENVTGLLSAEKGKHFRNIQKDFRDLGYIVEPFNVNANEFGVLQNRKRIIIIGWKKELNLAIGQLMDQNRIEYTVDSIFRDLPELRAGEGKDKYFGYADKSNGYLDFAQIRNGIPILTQHITRPHTEQDKEIYRIAVGKWKNNKERLDYNDLPKRLKTHKNRDAFLDRFKVVADDKLFSQTVVAHIAKDGHYYIHPDIEQNRSISVREAAQLQSFPDDDYFEGIKEGQNRTPVYRQTGNAIPPLIAEIIAA